MTDWIPYAEVNFSDISATAFHVDTRDFHVAVHHDYKEPLKWYNGIKDKEYYFHTPAEVSALIDRYYKESGGKKEWRFFMINNGKDNWSMKYIRIFVTKKGLVVCDSNNKPIKKSELDNSVKASDYDN